MSDTLLKAVRRGWWVSMGAGPHWRDGGRFHFTAKRGDFHLEGGAASAIGAQRGLLAKVATAEKTAAA